MTGPRVWAALLPLSPLLPLLVGPGSATALIGCAARAGEAEPAPGVSQMPARRIAEYSFQSLDARPVNSTTFAGRPVVIAFIATWDLMSQAQVRYLSEMDKHDQGKVAYVAVFLQDAKDRELIDVYRTTVGVSFPMAFAAQGTLHDGPFGDVSTVPTVVVLDARGQVRFQKVGLTKSEEIRQALSTL